MIFETKGLEKSYGKVLNSIDLYIDRGTKSVFVGQNGQGKSTLAKLLVEIYGNGEPSMVDTMLRLAILPQNQSGDS